MIGHLSERRNSLDSTVANLQSTLSAQKDEIADYKTKMDEMQVEGDKTEEIASGAYRLSEEAVSTPKERNAIPSNQSDVNQQAVWSCRLP